METIGAHCSETERRADEATRDAVNFLKCEYLSHRLGEHYEGIISAVTNFGIFVELQPLYVEGLVHVTELGDDYFVYDRARHCLVGERTKRRFRIGDSVKVQIAQVNLDERKVELRLLKAPDELNNEGEELGVAEVSGKESVDEKKARKPRRGRGGYGKRSSYLPKAGNKTEGAPKSRSRKPRNRKPRKKS
jgi:ribonuclease R